MAYVKIDQFDTSKDEPSVPFEARHSLDRSISKLSRLGGYIALFVVMSGFIIGGALLL